MITKTKTKPKKQEHELNYKQKKFADCYKGNGPDAAKEAGYSGNRETLRATASRLLTNNNVLKAIEKRQKEEKSKLNATREEKLELLTDMMRDETTLLITKKDGIEEISANIKPTDRIKAVELHCKMTGDLILKHEHSGNLGVSFKDGLKQVRDHLKSHPEEEKKMLEELEDEDTE